MKARLIAVFLFCLGTWCIGQAQTNLPLLGVGGSSSFSPSCNDSTNFANRTSGLTAAQLTNYDNFLCGINMDGVGCTQNWDAIYALWAPNSTTSLLNLCSSSFALTKHGTITFTANQGYVGDASTGYLDTGFQPQASGSFFASNSAGMGVCVLSSRTTNQAWDALGSTDSTTAFEYILRPLNSGQIIYTMGSNLFPSPANSNAQGLWSVYEPDATHTNLYKNNSSTTFDSAAQGSLSHTYGTLTIAATNESGGPVVNFSGDTIGFAMIGGPLSGANSQKFANRVETFMTAVGQSGC